MDWMRPVLGACLLATGIALAGAQQYPTKPIRFIAPFPPAGSSDLIIRILSQRMSEELGQPVVVENRPGAGGSLGTEMSAKAPPDGYTLRLGSIGGFAINPHLYKHVGYDPVKDFTPVAALGVEPLILQPSQLTEFVRSELAQYGRILKELGIAAQ